MTDLDTLVRLSPTPELWSQLVDALSQLEGVALDDAIVRARPALSWPARLRAVGDDSPWLTGVFEAARDPRLALVGWASVKRTTAYRYMEGMRDAYVMGALMEYGRLLDPTFDPPDVVLEQSNDITYASGCGGGTRSEKRGDAARGVRFHDQATEHSADMENDGTWVAYGLAEGCALRIDRNDYIGSEWTFTATGPTPGVFEVAVRWGTLSA